MPSSAPGRTGVFRETSKPTDPAEILRMGIDALKERLPPGWALSVRQRGSRRGDVSVDDVLDLDGPGGARATFAVQVKGLATTRDVLGVLDQLRRSMQVGDFTTESLSPLIIARYLAPETRERIIAEGAGYADATGNVYLALERPAIFLRDRGADADPWRGPGRPRGTLKGQPAARVVRALADFAPPYSVPDLADRAGASRGATYRVVEFLEGEALLDRERYGPISAVRWRAVLERWSQDYGVAATNAVRTFLEPRGLSALTEKLRANPELAYVLTGTLAAERLASYAPARLATLYVRDTAEVADALGLREVEGGGNVALASAAFDVVFDRAENVDGLRMAAASQVAVDLLTGPGRNPGEAVALLDWMEGNEDAWRR
ncbi:hypothetical protein [Patulibacter minatonensis]|uniref:hypothetical protein n=1 Tax=Patulibacter minatonensis TaxID=298163 RepID=UPI00146FC604|nr:hypothetical protein [Patulibacter minatonensis]